jgi:hypothetical protein
MNKVILISFVALGLTACTPRERNLVAAGVVGAAAGAVVANEVSQPRPQTVYVEERRYVAPPRRPRCYSVWERTYGGMVERRICE